MDVFQSIFNCLGEKLNDVLSWIVAFLPDSPFSFLDTTALKPYLSAINYFVPLDFIIDVTLAWLSCIVLYYAYSIVMRWIKVIH